MTGQQRICYFGDHIVQDVILPSKHTTTWDLVAVVKEIRNLYLQIERVRLLHALLEVLSFNP